MRVNLQKKQNLYEKTALSYINKICTTAAMRIKGTALVVILHRHEILAESANRGS